MTDKHRPGVSQSANAARAHRSTVSPLIVPAIDVVREGRSEPFLDSRATRSSAPAQWPGIALENYTVPAVFIRRHEHPENFLSVVLSGAVKYEVCTKGRTLRFTSRPGTMFLLPRGTVDEVNWAGPTQRMAVAIHPSLLSNALEETAHENEIELTEHWDLLAVYLVKRYAVRQVIPVIYKGGLPGFRLKRVLDYIAASLDENISLSQLAAIAGMSPHYFSELFKQSTGCAPHNYVLLQKIERAKQQLRDPQRSIIDAGLDAGFQNSSHFARMFRKLVGTTPSRYRADNVSRTPH
jgi:AraC family transcriptional regulator